ncbi:MAG: hypothetical protein JSW27_11715 [Phycisphaerales bacterium]|nr:MAG: hypothetical protein JSW27_11715 [Phycisphaerales bacterium]
MAHTQNTQRRYCILALVLLMATAGWSVVQEPTVVRAIPSVEGVRSVFTEGQHVAVPVPAGQTPAPVRWQALDDRGVAVRAGILDSSSKTIELGSLGIGWYRIEFLTATDMCAGWTTAAVLAKLKAPAPQDSPVCVDSATAWFAKHDPSGQGEYARLAALAGLNWIRDRIHWREIEPEPGRFEPATTYDTSADVQVKHGLKVLQVFHITPRWAVEEDGSTGRYPGDLRHVYRFCKAMARRFQGRVHAWEPWNEGNVANFGAHTADEMCTYQKAAYLGFKAGDPNVIVCWNVSTAVPTKLHTRVVLANETWSYYDTYNTHTYDWPDSYERLWKPVHAAACGRPIWITESDRGLAYTGPEPFCDLSRAGEIQKAEFMAQSYASSVFAGADRHFHFVLGHYCEGGTIQFGLLRLDKTPRPSYVALAALGRQLAGAECLGRWKLPDQPHAHIYAFRAQRDGVERDVLVTWAEKPGDWNQRGKVVIDWALPDGIRTVAVFDYLGRPLGSTPPAQLRSSPIFVQLTAGDAEKLPLQRPERSEYRPGRPYPIVLQLNLPRSHTVNIKQIPWASDHEHQVEPNREIDLPLYAYNFSDTTRSGTVRVTHAPAGWRLEPNTWDVTLAVMDRQALSCRFFMPKRESDKTSDNWIKLEGDFGDATKAVLVFRLISQPGEGYESDLPK